MEYLFIAIIGNRNIKYKGNFISNYLNENTNPYSNNFKIFTKYLLDHYEEVKEDLSPAILDELLNNKQEDLKCVYLISSDMDGVEKRTDQDTVYAGELLCLLFNNLYPNIHFENKIVKCSVYNHDQLIVHYRGILNLIKKNKNIRKIIYCDAGGTAQQKFSMKILLEYMFSPEQLEIWYVTQFERGKSKLLPGTIYEYRKIIDLEQIKILVNHSQYHAALRLGENLLTDFQKHLIQYAFYRFNLAYEDTRKMGKDLINRKKGILANNRVINESINKKSAVEHSEFLDFMDEKNFFILREILSLAKHNEQLKNYSSAILNFQQFIEHFLYSVILRLGFNIREDKYKYENENLLLSEIKSKFPELPLNFPCLKIFSIPELIKMADHSKNELCKKIIELICRTQKYFNGKKSCSYLDDKRNKFAHEGRMIKEKEYFEMPCLADLNEICQIFKLTGENLYENMNKLILDNL